MLTAFVVVGWPVAELRRRLDVERALNRHDSLTGLPNRRALREGAEILWAGARRSGRPMTLAYLDLDNFKKVNDGWGHDAGDRALIHTADVLHDVLRDSDLVARLGGDEFAMLLVDADPDAARGALERVRSSLMVRMTAEQWPVTVSVGAVCHVSVTVALEDALRDADALMYRAKSAGKNRVHIEATSAAPRAG